MGAAKGILETYISLWRSTPGWLDEGEYVLDGFKFIEKWVRANKCKGGPANPDLASLVSLIDLCKVSSESLKDTVKPSGLVSESCLFEIYEGRLVDGGLRGKNFDVLRTFGTHGTGPGQFEQIADIAVSGTGGEERVAVSDQENKRVLVFEVDSGECVATVGTEGDGPGEFQCPSGVAFNQQGELVVCDFDMNRIQMFDRHGRYTRGFGVSGRKNGELDGPGSVAVNRQGEIIVCDSGNYRVQIFRKDGTFVLAFGSEGSGEGQLRDPSGVAVASDGGIIISDSRNARVQIFSAFGSHVMTIGSRGEGPGQFLDPTGVAVSVRGEIVVSDNARHDVQVFSGEGTLLHTIGKAGDSFLELLAPNGVALDGDGRIFVGNQPSDGHTLLMLGGTSASGS